MRRRPPRLNLARALRLANEAVATLTIPDPWDLREFTEHVAERRGRPIRLVPRTMSSYRSIASGLWVREPDADIVVFDATSSPLHQENTVLHELAHMLLDHRGVPLPGLSPPGGPTRPTAEAGAAATTRPPDRREGDPPEEVPARVLHRDHYPDQAELEAETLAYTIWEAAGAPRALVTDPLSRMTAAFEHGQRRR
ncbi:ImmA/IrrE family metallo-endopeptidase [Actinoalloteichus caeruleus]|uniref:ImmA/IrrE family metallo-endopeptidase n=1 Tax=Actinoalloteichus cyanogriseus TaxID=2893586 RepID=UPI000AC2F36D|nr:ImmA/IrrE family metallo-endopeptidase [Actinoalloteichus caeruleus]